MQTAPLQPISVKPIQMPVYRNERIRSFAMWLQDNDHALTEYYNALKPYAPEGEEPLKDYFEFVAIAHEREELRVMSERLPHGAESL